MISLLRSLLALVLAVSLLPLLPNAQSKTVAPSSSSPAAASAPASGSAAPVSPSNVPAAGNSTVGSSNNTAPPSPTQPNNNNTSGNFVQGLPTSASIPYTAPAAYLSIVTPPAPTASQIPLYAINANVTLVWSYDQNLKVQPVNLTVCAVPSANTKYTYTISQIPGYQTSVVWNMAPLSTGGAPLINGKYQIQIFDQRGIKATYSPGWLIAATQLTIGLYNPEAYTPYANPSTCATCFFENNFPKDSLAPLATTFGVALLTTVGFLWFAL